MESSGVPPQHGMMLGHHQPSFAAHSSSNNNNNSHMMSPNSSSSMIPNARFPFNPTVTPQQAPPPQMLMTSSKPSDSLNSAPFEGSSNPGIRPSGFSIESSSGKKKRGRPRKYAPDGNIALGLTPTPSRDHGPSGDHGESGSMPSSETQSKKHRGRPPGSGKKQLDALGVSGVGFTPHVIMVDAGEDIASKIMAFSQQGPRTVCILAANGSICNVTLLQPAMSGGTVSYEGRFEIISLSGSFSPREDNGSHNQIGSLSVSLAGSDGRVLGGGVAGRLLAATPAHVIVGSFISDGKKTSSGLLKSGPSSAAPPPQILNFGSQVAKSASPSQGGLSESDDDDDDNNDNNTNSPPLNHGSGAYNNVSRPIQQDQKMKCSCIDVSKQDPQQDNK